MTVAGVSGGAVIDTDSDNINRYSEGASAATVTVPANASATITIKVELNAETMEAYDAVFPNGMFLEGFVFFDSEKEDVNIPFMGFRGDWTKAPIFDLATIYDDISGKATTDLDYPLFYTTMLSTVNDGSEAVLGANQFTENKWPHLQLHQHQRRESDPRLFGRSARSRQPEWRLLRHFPQRRRLQ